jgi:formylmethanofuran dehydrogenase subunit E
VGYYDGDSWSNHISNFIDCVDCGEEFDQQEEEGGNICPSCIEKEGEK